MKFSLTYCPKAITNSLGILCFTRLKPCPKPLEEDKITLLSFLQTMELRIPIRIKRYKWTHPQRNIKLDDI